MDTQIFGRPLVIPEIDAFLREYRQLCEKHGMKFTIGRYESREPCITLGTLADDDFLAIDLNHANAEIPGVRQAHEMLSAELKALRTVPR